MKQSINMEIVCISSSGKSDKKVAYQEGATGNQGEIINNIQQILVNKEAELFSKDEMIDASVQIGFV